MDLLHYLRRRLDLVGALYDKATAPFLETMRMMEAQEEPYTDNRDPETDDMSEPLFLADWQRENDSVEVLGQWCLCMVHASLYAYLKGYVERLGYDWGFRSAPQLVADKKDKTKKGWFDRYRLFFLENLRVDWNDGPVPLAELEQLNLTRNDFEHNVDVSTFVVKRDAQHAAKYPEGLFTDELWTPLGFSKLKIDRPGLDKAIHIVVDFCEYLERFQRRPPALV